MRGRVRGPLLVHLLLAGLAYLPLLRARPGRVGADTKTYLYLDPGELLSRALTMWDPNVGMGTVTHQTIGYLFPMGPWYWALGQAGLPDWLAQRLWLGTVLFAAASGMLFLSRTLAWRGPGAVVAALAYMLSPYVLDYSARISVILLPWAALPWLIGLTARALRRGGWRHPALFAITVALVGGVNATALVYAGLGPVLWIPFAVWVTREVTLRRALAAAARIGALTTLVSLWWLAGLAVQGGYGISILRYTETVEAVSRTSLASEVLRGLGYWFFYGNDKLGPWIEPAVDYTQRLWLIAVTFAVPVLALLGAAVARWRHRAYFVAVLAVGTVIAVGAHPYDEPSPLGAVFKAFAGSSTAGLALRSTARAVPLVALSVAVFLGVLVTGLHDRHRRAGLAAAVAAGGLVLAGMPPLFSGTLAVGANLDRPEEVPAYWYEAADRLDGESGTRVLELPGSDFAAYRWGNTVDPITPYLMDRPYVARELIPYGSPASADLLNALDRQLQEGVLDLRALAPVARLMGVGDVVLRNDLQFERYRTPRPRVLWGAVNPPPPGLGRPVGFGAPTPNLAGPKLPLIDELHLQGEAGRPHPPPVAALPVDDPVPIVRARPVRQPVLLAGDGEGVVDAASAGLLDGHAAVIYATSLGRSGLAAQLDTGADLLLTDSNRLRARRWGTVRETAGYTEQPGQRPLVADPGDARLDVFPGAGPDDHTIARQRGVRSVVASRYGNPVSYTPEDRPANALDGDVVTAWRVGAFADVTGERLRIDLEAPVRAERLTVLQPVSGSRNRFITRARLRFDGGAPLMVELGPESRQQPGQEVRFPARTFRQVEVEILETNVGRRPKYDGVSGVGIAELTIPGVRVDEVLRLPTALLGAAGSRSLDHRLVVLLTRHRADPAEPVRSDPEPHLARLVDLPVERTFTLRGVARLSAVAPDEAIDAIVGMPGAAEGGVTARSSGRLPGDLSARASAAIDGDPATSWSSGFGDEPAQPFVEYELAKPVRFSHLDLQLVADGRHSIPAELRLEVDGAVRTLAVPAVDPRAGRPTVRLTFDEVEGRRIRLAMTAIRYVTTIDYYSEAPIELPVALAEAGIPGVRAGTPAGLDGTCRHDVVTVDGQPVPVRLTGTVADAISRRPLALEPCGSGVTLAAGSREVRSGPGRVTTVDVDQLLLGSDRGGAALQLPAVLGARGGGPAVHVRDQGRTSATVAVRGAGEPFWLVLGQSHNAGWRATAGGRDLGPPRLLDGYANAWLVDPAEIGADPVIVLAWTPQRWVWAALAASAMGMLLCLAIVAATRGHPALAPALADRPAVSRSGGMVGHHVANHASRTGWWALGVTVAGAAVVAGPPVAVGLAAILVPVQAVPWARRFRPFLPAAALAAAALYVVVQQARYRFPPDFAWPTFTYRAHTLAWLAVGLLLADTAVRAGQRRRRRSRISTEQGQF